MASKTPVSILQEMMVRLGNPPKYDLIYEGTGTHEALFKYKVHANGITAIGSGRSKKEAKQEAAKGALEKLAEHQIRDSVPVTPEEMEVISPYEDNLHENAIGALHELCANNDIPMPKYQLTLVEGQPHARTFTFICCISKQKEYGVGRTKKQAKQQAANNMLNRVKQLIDQKDEEQLQDYEWHDADDSEENNYFKEAMKRYMAVMGTPRKKLKMNYHPAMYHKYFQKLDSDVVTGIQDLHLPEFETTLQCKGKPKEELLNEDWLAVLNEFVTKLNLILTFVPLKSNKAGIIDGHPSVRVMLVINTIPDITLLAYGSTIEEAQQIGALKALQYLQIMTK